MADNNQNFVNAGIPDPNPTACIEQNPTSAVNGRTSPDSAVISYLRSMQNTTGTDTVVQKNKTDSRHFFSLPARIGMWLVGTVLGATIIFGCALFWIWGIDMINDQKTVTTPGSNEFNQPSGDGYADSEDFYEYFDEIFGDYFGDYFAPVPGEDDDSSSQTQSGTPGIGVTIQQLTLDFVIEDKYTGGLVIIEINPNGALVGTEAKEGDLIVAANGHACATIEDLDVQLKASGVGGEMVLTLARYTNGVAETFDVTITLIDISVLN